MSRWLSMLVIAGCLVLMAGSVQAQGQMGVDYRTFAYADASKSPRPRLLSNALTLELERKGYHKVNSSQADMWVLYWAGPAGELLVELDAHGISFDQSVVASLPIGGLVVLMLDRVSGDVVYLDIAGAILLEMPSAAEVQEAVREFLRDMPPAR